MPGAEPYWDPFDVDLDDEPHGVWRQLRDDVPVYRNDRYDFWALSRHADVEAAHRDPATFSSAHGTVLDIMGPDMSSTGLIIFMDPPDHTILRALVSRAFTPRRMGEMEAEVREICAELLDPFVGAAEFDYVQDFAAQLPSMVIARLVGVPEEDREEQRRNIDETFHIEPGVGMINDVSLLARIRLNEYLAGLVERRMAEPADDLISALVAAEITDDAGETRRLTMEEITDFTLLLFSAGTETVMRLLGNAAVLLARYPEQRRVLLDDPSVIPNAVEELLRYEAPSPVQGRWTTREVTLHGVTIPAESKVLLLTGSAGRDERAYPDGDRFDVRRDLANHVSFGHGIHFCVGAALARLEGEDRPRGDAGPLSRVGLVPDRVVRQHTSTVRGYSEVGIAV